MQHGVRVNAVEAGIATTSGVYPTLVVALLSQQIVEVKGHDERLILEERLGYLTIPYQLVGVHRGIVIATTTALVQVHTQLEVERQAHQELSTVVKLPGIEVGCGLQLVAGVLVVELAIERHLDPIVTVAHGDALVQVSGTGGVLGGIGLILCHIAYQIVIAHTGIGTYIPMGSTVERRIKGKAGINVPVAVDILGTGDATTCFGVVTHQV